MRSDGFSATIFAMKIDDIYLTLEGEYVRVMFGLVGATPDEGQERAIAIPQNKATAA